MRLLRFVLLAALALPAIASAATRAAPIPRIVEHDGRYALLVDGAPYLILGAQVNNSSGWPAMMPKIWPAIGFLHANTVEIPIYWQQFEPHPNQFDYSILDLLLNQAREHRVRLVLLWFGTWKNGSAHYMPLWMKADPARYPRTILNAKGERVDSPSPYAPATLAADTKAFVALMHHLKLTDPQRTVIMVQVENEPGVWGTDRDYSETAQKLFESPVPAEVLAAYHKQAAAGAAWPDVFGAEAGVIFHAWSVSRFIGSVAAAGKKEYPLPLYVNAALRDPLHPTPPGSYESGGATDNTIPVWKAMAPAIDLVAPDIYMPDSARYRKILELYARPDNALFVPETGSAPAYARYFFAALGHGTIGFSPFGIDYTTYRDSPIGATRLKEETLAQFALNYELVEPMMREIARLNFEGKLKAVAESRGETVQTLDFGDWKAVVEYGMPGFGNAKPRGNPQSVGRALVARLGANEFLVAGLFCRVDFLPAEPGKKRDFLRVEEGAYRNGAFQAIRIWNGDQTDWGLNFTSVPQPLHVLLATY
jgi:beta-galactosidase GanA